jgi:hypothetical protein
MSIARKSAVSGGSMKEEEQKMGGLAACIDPRAECSLYPSMGGLAPTAMAAKCSRTLNQNA